MERVFGEHYAELKRAARMLARDMSEADDILQEAFLSALRNPRVSGLSEEEQLRYLRRAMRSRLIDLRRRERLALRRETIDAEPVGLDDLTCVEVMQALGELSDEQRQVVAMRVLGGMTSTQVAQALGIPAPTVRTRLRAALKRLRAAQLRDER